VTSDLDGLALMAVDVSRIALAMNREGVGARTDLWAEPLGQIHVVEMHDVNNCGSCLNLEAGDLERCCQKLLFGRSSAKRPDSISLGDLPEQRTKRLISRWILSSIEACPARRMAPVRIAVATAPTRLDPSLFATPLAGLVRTTRNHQLGTTYWQWWFSSVEQSRSDARSQ